MPELPEIETLVREMQNISLIGLKIVKVCVYWLRTIAELTSEEFENKLTHKIIESISRRGKWIIFTFANAPFSLLIHLRMTGKFLLDSNNLEPTSHERIRIYLNDGRILHFIDQRKFAKWHLINTDKILNSLGIEPLSKEFSLKTFKQLLKGKRQIKPFLLDQHNLAGIGNIYADEALWMARIHPLRTVNSLTDKEIEELHYAILTVLKKGIKNAGTSLGSTRANYSNIKGQRGGNQNQLNVFRLTGSPCPRCQTSIKKIVVGQRGTHFCPNCQNENLSYSM